jgi:CheY-like chemotaxis protein
MKEKKPGRPLVLVVEDFEDAREMYALYLGHEGFGVVQARDGYEALKLAAEKLPDLILMDLALPGMDGWEATRRIKNDPRTRHIPVVALTGHVLAGHAEGARQAGCDSFVIKPCLPDALVAEVRRMLSMTQAAPRPGPAPSPAGDGVKPASSRTRTQKTRRKKP